MPIHKNYELLTETEKAFVDKVFHKDLFTYAKLQGIKLNGSDPCERAVEAFATWVIESREKQG